MIITLRIRNIKIVSIFLTVYYFLYYVFYIYFLDWQSYFVTLRNEHFVIHTSCRLGLLKIMKG